VTQALDDSRSPGQALRRRWRLLAAATVLGLAAGGAYLTQQPPRLASTALVLLPPEGEARGAMSDAVTQAEIAGSATILGPVGAAMTPPASVRTLELRVSVEPATDQLLQIRAYASDADQAEALAQAVADTYVAYVKTSAAVFSSATLTNLTARQTALAEQVVALSTEVETTAARLAKQPATSAEARRDAQLLAQLRSEEAAVSLRLDQVEEKIATTAPPGTDPASGTAVIQPASPATGRPLLWQLAVWPLAGALLTTLLTAGGILARSRGDRRLRSRDEIADAAGAVVLASLRVRPQRSTRGWSRLLAGYTAGPVDAWAVRRLLRDLIPAAAAPRPSGRGKNPRRPAGGDHPSSVVILTLSGDVKALAVGPQLAACAASLGIATRLVTGSGHPSGAALWNACGLTRTEPIRAGLALGGSTPRERASMTVTLAQLDRLDPKPGELPRTGTVLLAVGAARCTEEDLARLTMALHEAGRRLDGVVVADPDRSDRSSGRLLTEEQDQVVLPLRVTGGIR
jgi:hypothetical protein